MKTGIMIIKLYTEPQYKPSTQRAYRYRANKSFDASGRHRICSGCGSDRNIQIHHKNKDESDNRPENQTPLCKKCHDKVHWYLNFGDKRI